MILIGNNIYLRPLHLNDANGNYPNWLNDPEVCRYNSHGSILYTKEMAHNYIEQALATNTQYVFAICDKSTNQHIGNISLQNISYKNESAEFAILMGEKAFWGKGFSKEAGRLLINYGFSILKLHRIYCGTNADNLPMQKLALSLNMDFEGRQKEAMKKNNIFYDILEYAILASSVLKK